VSLPRFKPDTFRILLHLIVRFVAVLRNLIKKFRFLHRTRGFITMFTRAQHWPICCDIYKVYAVLGKNFKFHVHECSYCGLDCLTVLEVYFDVKVHTVSMGKIDLP
jgi:hypothetical protein